MTTFYQCGDANSAVFPESNAVARECGRPVVVIDPEDREAVERLQDLFADERDRNGGQSRLVVGGWADAMQAALREYANPKPPKPEEPAGLGAIVEDADGNPWVKTLPGIDKDAFEWIAGFPSDPKLVAYKDIDAVKVLSPGVE